MSLPPITTWAVTDAGLTIYRDGKPVTTVPVTQFGMLIYRLSEQLLKDIREERD